MDKRQLNILDAMVYSRGSKDDFDSYADLANNSIWSWKSVEGNWARKNEKLVAPNDGHNTVRHACPCDVGLG